MSLGLCLDPVVDHAANDQYHFQCEPDFYEELCISCLHKLCYFYKHI